MISKYVSLLNTLAAIQLNRSILYSQSINNTMSLVRHNRTAVAKPIRKTDMLKSISKQSGESGESVLKKKRKAMVGKICRNVRF